MTGTGWLERTWSIALFGHLNPAIINARWLEDARILEPTEAAAAIEDERSLSSALQSPPLALEATLERFLIQTQDGQSTGRLLDIVRDVFQILEHTPITSVAMGLDGEWAAANEDDQRRVLDRVVHGQPDLGLGTILARSATLRTEGLSGPTAIGHVTIEDSDAAENSIYFSVVDEIDVSASGTSSAASAVGAIEPLWPQFVTSSRALADKMVGT